MIRVNRPIPEPGFSAATITPLLMIVAAGRELTPGAFITLGNYRFSHTPHSMDYRNTCKRQQFIGFLLFIGTLSLTMPGPVYPGWTVTLTGRNSDTDAGVMYGTPRLSLVGVVQYGVFPWMVLGLGERGGEGGKGKEGRG